MMNLENKNLMKNIMMSQQKNIYKVKYKLKDDFEINEIDEDLYNESNCEISSNKNSKNQRKVNSKKIITSPTQIKI